MREYLHTYITDLFHHILLVFFSDSIGTGNKSDDVHSVDSLEAVAENPTKDRGKEALKNIHITSSYTEHITTKKATEPQIVEIIEDDNDLNSTTDKIKTYENPTFNKAAAAGIAEIQEDRKDETIADKKPIILVEKEASSFNTEDLDESKIKWCTPFIEDSSEICIQDSLEEVKYLAMELINVSYCWLMSHYVKFLYLGRLRNK